MLGPFRKGAVENIFFCVGGRIGAVPRVAAARANQHYHQCRKIFEKNLANASLNRPAGNAAWGSQVFEVERADRKKFAAPPPRARRRTPTGPDRAGTPTRDVPRFSGTSF